MAIPRYLAMRPVEIAQTDTLPENAAWMLCPFSPEDACLWETIEADTLIILTDSTPVDSRIADPLINQLLSINCRGLILDFQRPDCPEAVDLASKLLQALPFPTAVSETYAGELNCPVFLSPVPLHQRLTDYIAPWKGRNIWLDISADGERITLTESGASIEMLPRFFPTENGHQDNQLHCHYAITLTENTAEFTLWRTDQDLMDLLQEAEDLGIHNAVGLYQEWQRSTIAAFRGEC